MTVYQPSDDSYMMLEALKGSGVKPGDRVLDMGTGSGILAIAAEKRGCSVTAVDINPEAIKAAKEAAKKEGARIRFAVSDLFESVKGSYDLILFNAPYVGTERAETKDMESAAWDGGFDGLQVIYRFLSMVKRFLKPRGQIMMTTSSMDDVIPKFPGFDSRPLAKKSFFFERLWVMELQPRNASL